MQMLFEVIAYMTLLDYFPASISAYYYTLLLGTLLCVNGERCITIDPCGWLS